jgi:hypothetical protein
MFELFPFRTWETLCLFYKPLKNNSLSQTREDINKAPESSRKVNPSPRITKSIFTSILASVLGEGGTGSFSTLLLKRKLEINILFCSLLYFLNQE